MKAPAGNGLKNMRTLLWIAMAALLTACANVGRPGGGPKDELPPVFLHSDPMPGSTNVNRTRMSAYFDENIQLEDAFSKVVVSPAQKTPPSINANGRRLSVEFHDTLLPNTTYTIDFADAIKDLNEGNILDGFALDFSTGPTIDSLRISGMVIQAENLEPAQGMLVGVYSNLSDTALTTLPLERIARTNQYGHFTIRNLKPGTYRIFAINDVNRDYHWDRSEDIAFYDTLITPYTERIEVTDTLFSHTGEDSIVTRPGIKYLPNDILLSWFNVGYKAQYLLDYKRPERRKITIGMAAASDTLPIITIADGAPGAGRDISEWALLQGNATNDTLVYWIKDPEVLASDSLRLSVKYLKTDSTDNLSWTTDTLRFFYRDVTKKKKDKKEDKTPRFTVDSITGDTTFLPDPFQEYMGVKVIGSGVQDIHLPFLFEVSQPLEVLDTAGIHLETMVDTVWEKVNFKIETDSSNVLLRKKIDINWIPGARYKLTMDTLSLIGIYNITNRPFKNEFSVKEPEDYSSINFILPGLEDEQVVVQVLSGDLPAYQTIKAPGASGAQLKFLNPGTYYARLIIDSNNNGKWDTGNPVDSLQPEEVYYFAKKLDLKKNWDVEQTWIFDELPVDSQKPYAIKKNKPKLKRGEKAPVDKDEDEMDENDPDYNPFDKTGRQNRSSTQTMGGNGMKRSNI